MRCQHAFPTNRKALLVGDLMTFDAFCHIGARALAFEMHHDRMRLVEHAPPCRAHAESQIGVFVISGRIGGVEAAERIPKVALDHQTSTRAVIDFTHIVVFRLARIVATADVPRRAVAPDDAAGLLQSAIGVNKLCTHQSGVRELLVHRCHFL